MLARYATQLRTFGHRADTFSVEPPFLYEGFTGMFAALFRRLRTALPFLFVISLTACGGGGGGLPPAHNGTSSQIPLTIVSESGNNITLTGTVDYVQSATEFQIQGGQGVGYLNIYVTSSTIVNGPKPFVGENVEITGTGSPSTSVTASEIWQISSTPIPSASPSPTVITLPTGVVSETAQVTAIVSSSKIEVNGGAGCGYTYVYTSSSTNYWGGSTPKVGQYGDFVGTGTRCSSIAASSIIFSQTAMTSTTVSGTISAATSYGFTLNTGTSSEPIALTSSTSVSGTMTVGSSVSITGVGSSTTAITASSITVQAPATPTPAPTAPPTPAPTASSTPAPSGAPIPLPTGVFAVSGPIDAIVGSTKFEINAGSGCGYMYVYTSSSTNDFGSTPATGLYGEYVGTGTKCGSENATAITLSTTPLSSTTASGTVSGQTSYGFTLNTGSTSVPIVLTSSTVVYGATLTVGSSVSVTGIGVTSSAITATQIAVQPPPTPVPTGTPTPTPGPISTTHIMTADILYGYGGTPTTTSLSSVAPYVTWVQTDPSYAAQIRAAGIKVDVYSNFWRNYTSDNPNIGYSDLEPGGAHAAAEAADCSGNVIYDSSYGGGYETDARTSAALGHAQVVADYRLNEFKGTYDALFSDDSAAVWGITLPCNWSQSTYDAAVNSLHSALGVTMWINALGAAPDPSTETDLVSPSNVLGAMCEVCYAGNSSNGDYIQTGTSWSNVENAELGVIAQHKVFWDYARATGDPSSETALRTYVYASLLLGGDPSYIMLQEAFQSATGFPVMPESGLVALNPLATATSVSGYQAAGGAYFREFGACYYQGDFVGNCAVAVNPGSGSVPVPSTSYTHSLVLSGAGVLDGGSVAFNGPNVTQLAPGSAVILFP